MIDSKLVREVRKYLRGLPSHVRERYGARLLQQLLEAYEKHGGESPTAPESVKDNTE